MKYLAVLILSIIFSFAVVYGVNAQAAETIWIKASPNLYKTAETVIATVNAITATPIQGFNIQISYDPACLQALSATSPVTGMNGLAVPQTSGFVDASFASTSPQTANGVLAEVRFVALKGCQTSLSIETAALVIRNESGFAAPLPSLAVDHTAVVINIDTAVGVSQPTLAGESVLPLAPTIFPEPEPVNVWVVVLMVLLIGIAITTVVVVVRLSRQ